ncbi:MAG: hypothetical protein IH986_19060 [Planctomycetes bacterium]|nr:hypothetical protein [Planctomycetota bacterium]
MSFSRENQGWSRPVIGLAGVVWLGVWLPGCANWRVGNGEAAAGPAVSAVRHPILEDIPKPAGFSLVDDHSVARSSGKFRVAKVEFVGSTARDAVYQFYKEYMPSAGFELTQQRFDRGEHEMRFQSSSEECTIRIRKERFGTTIVVDIGPLPEGSPLREPTPVTRRP